MQEYGYLDTFGNLSKRWSNLVPDTVLCPWSEVKEGLDDMESIQRLKSLTLQCPTELFVHSMS